MRLGPPGLLLRGAGVTGLLLGRRAAPRLLIHGGAYAGL